jgi:N-acetylglucosaminyldiphosphoundecaprenol N-acetyl-beta-D-mannosaminyltransferase
LQVIERIETTSVGVWGLRLAPLTFDETIARVHQLVNDGEPTFFITANVHYAMLTASDPRLTRVNEKAAFLVADGMPLVWASRGQKTPLPERVAGADLLPALCGDAARSGYRVFLLGGGPGAGEEAARRLLERLPRLQIVGIEAPVLENLSQREHEQLRARIRQARPDLLFAALGQPKGELWLAENYLRLGVPVSVQVGAALDFVAGRVPRSPRLLQRVGMEWAYRLYREPLRLTTRYARNAWFALRMLARDAMRCDTAQG